MKHTCRTLSVEHFRSSLLHCGTVSPSPSLWLGTRFVPPISGSEVTCELEFTIPDDDKFFDDKVRGYQQQSTAVLA